MVGMEDLVEAQSEEIKSLTEEKATLELTVADLTAKLEASAKCSETLVS